MHGLWAVILVAVLTNAISPVTLDQSVRTKVDLNYTFVVSVRSLSLHKHLFTGSIISETAILTTCHNLVSFSWNGKPIDNFNRSDYRVYTVGAQFHLNRQVAGVHSVSVHKHCNADQSGINFNLGMIRLLHELFLGDGINVTPLPSLNTKRQKEILEKLISSDAKFTLLTWAEKEVEKDGEVSQLEGFTVAVHKWDRCSNVFCGSFCDEKGSIDKFCAKHEDENCPGDSGAPLMYKNVTWAIASIAQDRCPKGYRIYTRIDSSMSWIQLKLMSSASENAMHHVTVLIMILLILKFK